MKKMHKKFCISTKGLSKDQRKELATELSELVKEKKSQFKEENQETGE